MEDRKLGYMCDLPEALKFKYEKNNDKRYYVDSVEVEGIVGDPSAQDNWAIRWACEYGHTEVVKLLLGDERVDPADYDNYAVRWASEKGHIEVVKLLLKDKRVDPSDDNNRAVGWACENGHAEIVKLLLEDERVDPADRNSYAVQRSNLLQCAWMSKQTVWQIKQCME